jgi:hypothetical protein
MGYRGNTTPAAPVHLEVVSADASAGVAFTLYAAGSTTSRALAGTEILMITDIIFVSTAGGTFNIVAGNADAVGKRIAKGNVAATGGLVYQFATPFKCPVGVLPYLFAAAGQVDCVLTGYILAG